MNKQLDQWVAFLRGMNLGGRRVKNDELVDALEGIGMADVVPFLASGNLVFRANGADEGALAKRIEVGLRDAFHYDVPTFLRTADEVRAIVEFESFPAELIEGSQGKLQIAMLPSEPSAEAKREALGLASEDDRLAIEGRELYWLPAGGFLESKIDLRRLEKLLGPWTVRTQGTVERLAKKFL